MTAPLTAHAKATIKAYDNAANTLAKLRNSLGEGVTTYPRYDYREVLALEAAGVWLREEADRLESGAPTQADEIEQLRAELADAKRQAVSLSV